MAITRTSLAVFFLRQAGKLSLRMAQRLGRLLGTLSWWFPSRSKKVTTANIDLVAQNAKGGVVAPVSTKK